MAWTTSTKKQRRWVGKTEAKESGRRALRQEEHDLTVEELEQMLEEAEPVELLRRCPHCGGYGGRWTRALGEHHVGWAQPPDWFDDGVGYAMCVCMTSST